MTLDEFIQQSQINVTFRPHDGSLRRVMDTISPNHRRWIATVERAGESAPFSFCTATKPVDMDTMGEKCSLLECLRTDASMADMTVGDYIDDFYGQKNYEPGVGGMMTRREIADMLDECRRTRAKVKRILGAYRWEQFMDFDIVEPY
jgi:hypothetical protein